MELIILSIILVASLGFYMMNRMEWQFYIAILLILLGIGLLIANSLFNLMPINW